MTNKLKNILAAVAFTSLLLGSYVIYSYQYSETSNTSSGEVSETPETDNSIGTFLGQKLYKPEDAQKQLEALRTREPHLLEVCFGDLCTFQAEEIEKVKKALEGKVRVDVIDLHLNPQILPHFLYKSDGKLPRHVLIYKNQEFTLTGVHHAPAIIEFVNSVINSKIFYLSGENRRDMLQYLPKNLPLLYILETPESWQKNKDKLEAVAQLFAGQIAIVYVNPDESKGMAKRIYQNQRLAYPGYKLYGLDNKEAKLVIGDMELMELAQFVNHYLTKWDQYKAAEARSATEAPSAETSSQSDSVQNK